MALPKIQQPIFEFIIPSNKKKIKLRPMLVKEEKILLISKQSGSQADIMNGIKQVINSCIVTENINIDRLAIFDLEYLFIKLRSISISNISKLSYKDGEDGKIYDFEINLDKEEIDMSKAQNNKIQLNKDLLLELSWPSVELYSNNEIYEAAEDKLFDVMLKDCINKIYEGDKAYDAKNADAEELNEFINNIPAKAAEEIRNFFVNIPRLYHKIEYKNSKGTDRVIELKSLDDFFTL